ncbi:MAG: zinc ribbon domain-containing protein [Planctomycetes bacterium]|nr:zinc ribbon domain-containing protein [Planctomycetota bacterium]
MPIYEFACARCGATFEELLPSSRRDEPQKCPSCGARAHRGVTACAAPAPTKGGCGPGGRGRVT